MMQSAVALAASQQATKALGDADKKNQLGGDDGGGVPRLTGR